ncbi:putative sporulation-specific N-formyltyrosine oxidase Dit2 [Aspergillus indologenus CBS 114.80]|uniref:Putative sporulation-specific N-formyltyrosine oxidase Dit2 n=1 Tax=Aspergillus indologenus CBS 114.80 TaxID=1450541 RepID=A0A2V5IV55_9EURO|nr:putative sporulation-specific N-formyltyrosine oxidase Dit2 [Aspergillus indologenus CBS 114.80]
MQIVTAIAIGFLLAGAIKIWIRLRPPSSLPRDLPRIPLYTVILALWWDLSNFEIYNRWIRAPLEKHGAVCVFHTGRWNVLVGHPGLVNELFRNEAVYSKAGNHVRAPSTALGALVGDNIVNSTQTNHRLYKSVMQPGLQRRFDAAPFIEKSRILVDRLIAAQKVESHRGVLVLPWLQKFTLDLVAVCFLGFEMKALNGAPVEQLLTQVKPGVFHPITMKFPAFDRLWWLVPSRRRIFQLVREFDHVLYTTVRQHTRSNPPGLSNMLSHLLEDALQSGQITDKQFRSNIIVTLMAGHDNTEFLFACGMMVLGRNPAIQDRLRTEVMAATGAEPAPDALSRLPYLTSFIYELLRLYPPISQMFNRMASRHASLGDRIPIQPQTSVAWTAYGLQTNPQIWGPTAAEFQPERWGSTVPEIQAAVRRETVRGHYIPFSAYSRKCPAQEFALLQVRVTLFELVRRIRWTVDPQAEIKMSSGTHTFPIGLRVIIDELDALDAVKV